MSNPNISTVNVQRLTLKDTVKTRVRHIGQKRRHLFTACNHSIEDHHCMYPPEHTERVIRQISHMDAVVRFRGLCNKCEERRLIPNAIVEEVKKIVQGHMVGFVDVVQASSLTEGSVRWAKNKLVVDFKYKKMGQTNTKEGEGNDYWGVFPVVVSPSASDPSRTGALKWEEVYVEIASSPTLIHARLDIQTHMYGFEQKWNEPIQGSRSGRGSIVNQSSETNLSSVFPPFPELLPQGARVLEDHYRYDDPDLFETLPYATPE
ncbi:hypothetical protein EYB25_004599 [Talaromyces marneffei]|nr:hypothetical protein EYB25_004599 [Talaromyces marneffei]